MISSYSVGVLTYCCPALKTRSFGETCSLSSNVTRLPDGWPRSPGSNPGIGKAFLCPPKSPARIWVPNMCLFNGCRRIVPGVKRPRCETNEVKNKGKGNPHSIYHSVHRDTFTWCVHFQGINHNPEKEVSGASEKVVTAYVIHMKAHCLGTNSVPLLNIQHVSVNTNRHQVCIYRSTSGTAQDYSRHTFFLWRCNTTRA